MDARSSYPNVEDIIARKARGRMERGRLTFGEKLDLLEKLRTEIAPIIRARLARELRQREKAGEPIDFVD